MDPMTETHIPGWHLVDVLGRGDFSTVFRAVEQDSGSEVALKLSDGTKAARERLQVEVEALQSLDHAGVPRVIRTGSTQGRPYFAMTLAGGRTLDRLIAGRTELGQVHGDIEALHIVRALLDVVAHVHGHGLVHRDIKEANVIVDGLSSLMLVDFGFCKASGATTIRNDDSFFRAGAARFSPPSKLDSPGHALPTHDVFAVGVVGYRLLTGEFPWSAPEKADASALRDSQREDPLVPAIELNPRVDRRVSDLVSQMLILEDEWRPAAASMLGEINAFLDAIDKHGLVRRRSTVIRYNHVIRDPLYGDIRLADGEYRALDTAEMQRLRVIKQLGLTDMVYPGAVHSRLNHSIGCVERVERILSRVERAEGIRIDPDLRLVTRLFALTHDVAHIPAGHTIEDELGFFQRHDRNRIRIERLLDRQGSELGDVLRSSDIGRAVIGLLTGEAADEWPLTQDLVSGVTGADVLDYVDRDAYFCGVDHRIDSALERQFSLQRVDGTRRHRLVSLIAGKYGVRMDRKYAVESVLRERYAMFLKIYTHSAKIAASALLGKAVWAAINTSTRRSPFSEERLEWLGDEALLIELAGRSGGSRSIDDLRRRRLPLAVYRAALVTDTNRPLHKYDEKRKELDQLGIFEPTRRAEHEARLATEARLDPEQVSIYCPAQAPGYQRVDHWVTMSRRSSATREAPATDYPALHIGLWDLWVFARGVTEEAEKVALGRAAQNMFGLVNVVNVRRRDGRLR